MAEITVPVRKFLRLFDYMERVGIDVSAVAATVDDTGGVAYAEVHFKTLTRKSRAS